MTTKEVDSKMGMHLMSDEYFFKGSEKSRVNGANLLFKKLGAIIFAGSRNPGFQHFAP